MSVMAYRHPNHIVHIRFFKQSGDDKEKIKVCDTDTRAHTHTHTVLVRRWPGGGRADDLKSGELRK